jgi:uncharacterized protein YprB with RNaseH-like and TPR domain
LPGTRAEVLAELRERIAEVVGMPDRPRPPPADPAKTELPFVADTTPSGTVYRRTERLRPSHHVGRIPSDAARLASAEVLALLALDPTLGLTEPARALYLDCESTGLGGAGTVAFLVGLGWFDGGHLVLEQLLLKSPADERALLEVVSSRMDRASLLVTYNGKTFDRPLLSTRCVMTGLPSLADRPHLDLLHVARRLHRGRLGVCRLVDLESSVLGFERGPDIEGAEVAARYSHFLRSGDEGALRAVVDHNAWDVLTMAALVGLYGEPLPALHDRDLLGLAETYRRAKALDHAEGAAACAEERGVGPEAVRLQARIAKARGDRARALSRFEELARSVDDPDVRLELAKLYEHHVKEPALALRVVESGTSETEAATEHRRRRLQRKLARRRGSRG